MKWVAPLAFSTLMIFVSYILPANPLPEVSRELKRFPVEQASEASVGAVHKLDYLGLPNFHFEVAVHNQYYGTEWGRFEIRVVANSNDSSVLAHLGDSPNSYQRFNVGDQAIYYRPSEGGGIKYELWLDSISEQNGGAGSKKHAIFILKEIRLDHAPVWRVVLENVQAYVER